ncbi:PREDICTED: peptidyl-prolyl cis-trans isomerase CYP28, chloroplastic-like [Nelumbo nucifera]|uniref:PPIase cyclophilin-type domain-containing protein n=2 Tax=Nelumbo nucifera TaxID=4432 RepID=A0A822ZX23_NELNU|nr:PREDICTED: peptidyl-prolyl cis-trans isomerase CYP28, chloroplastic-like [Nelumbo nucifera]DAD47895.1 TPA_asm: hypothetical protein HUJ06_017832 [Nelumbo nucifera]
MKPSHHRFACTCSFDLNVSQEASSDSGSGGGTVSRLPVLALAADENETVPPPPLPPVPDTTITDRVYMDFSLGDEFAACQEAEPLGRVVFGLYGKLVPLTVSNFKAMCTGSSGSSYKEKIFPGQFLMAGRQGRRDKGEVRPPSGLVRNTKTVDSKSFLLSHLRPGVLSLCLSENDDDEEIKLNPNYRNVEFLITTGPGPSPQLDNTNIVFGAVLEGWFCLKCISLELLSYLLLSFFLSMSAILN